MDVSCFGRILSWNHNIITPIIYKKQEEERNTNYNRTISFPFFVSKFYIEYMAIAIFNTFSSAIYIEVEF